MNLWVTEGVGDITVGSVPGEVDGVDRLGHGRVGR